MRVGLFAVVFAISLLIFSASALAASDIKPKSVTSATIKITKTGTLVPTGSVQSASLTLYIAQDGQQSLTVTPNDYEIVTDANGNKMVKIKFGAFSGPQSYSLVQVVKASAQTTDRDYAISDLPAYTTETSGAQITPEISAAAYPYEKSLSGVADMASWVNGYMTYDKSVYGQNKPSDWVFANKRGVCVEYSNLLAAMLRSKGIPTRYVSGFAYSTTDGKLIGHEWVEVYVGGRWVGFDPTWLEGGFIDATHVRTSVSAEGVEKETLSYLGSGELDWEKNSGTDSVELVDHTSSEAVSIDAEAPFNLPLSGGGYIKAATTFSGCRLFELTASSCADEKGKPLLNMADEDRDIWGCGSANAIWTFTYSVSKGYTYSCPVLVYDQSGSSAQAKISLGSAPEGSSPELSGPDSAGAGQTFTITTSDGSKLFSTQLGESLTTVWRLSITKPGSYDFYAYANGKLARKVVRVSSQQDLVVSATAPSNTSQNSVLTITVTAKSSSSEKRDGSIKLTFGNQTLEKQVTFKPNENVVVSFNVTAYESGDNVKYLASAQAGTSFAGYSGFIKVIPVQTGFGGLGGPASGVGGIIDNIMAVINSIIKAITDIFSGGK